VVIRFDVIGGISSLCVSVREISSPSSPRVVATVVVAVFLLEDWSFVAET
jgi:hypothetical protein